MEIKELFLSVHNIDSNSLDINNDNTDVVVELKNGNRYIAPFFAYGNINKLQKEHYQSGEYLNGKYFYAHNMILVDQCSQESIHETVQHLIDEGEFLLIFKRITR